MSDEILNISDSVIAPTADIDETAVVLHSKIGERCWLAQGTMFCYSELGTMSYLSTRSKAFSSKIGKFSSISWNVSIGPANHDYKRVSSHAMLYATRFGMIENPEERFYNQYDGETVIGNDVWIGCNAVIMRGVHIGDGAVIGANAIITKDVAPFSIMGGVNHVIKKRFDDKIIDKLQEIEWWNSPLDIIKNNIDLISKQPTLESLKILQERLMG